MAARFVCEVVGCALATVRMQVGHPWEYSPLSQRYLCADHFGEWHASPEFARIDAEDESLALELGRFVQRKSEEYSREMRAKILRARSAKR